MIILSLTTEEKKIHIINVSRYINRLPQKAALTDQKKGLMMKPAGLVLEEAVVKMNRSKWRYITN